MPCAGAVLLTADSATGSSASPESSLAVFESANGETDSGTGVTSKTTARTSYFSETLPAHRSTSGDSAPG